MKVKLKKTGQNVTNLLLILLLLVGCEDAPAEQEDVYGCKDEEACNYDSDANINDDCFYPSDLADDICDCEGTIIDKCDVCGGDGYLFDEFFENTWILNHGEYSSQEWDEWDFYNTQTYTLYNYDYILNISCNNFNIYWHNDPYLWEFYGTWKPHIPDEDNGDIDDWIDQYSYLDRVVQ